MIAIDERVSRIGHVDNFIGDSNGMQKVRDVISLVAPHDTPVLIMGETGTGKELAARQIHDMSLRSHNPFVVINGSTLQDTMVESELFGYKRGAFTGADTDKPGLLEVAHQGTLFLDEVGEVTLNAQAKLLRAIETGTFRRLGDTKEIKVDVRFILATNRRLSSDVNKGGFRKDLFYRISAITLDLPPLRDRKEDIPLLMDYFLNKFAGQKKSKWFSPKAIEWLGMHDWPGNVRELANTIERATILSGDRAELTVEDLPNAILQPVASFEVVPLADAELIYVQKIMKLARGNKSQAARLLGIGRKRLYEKLHNIEKRLYQGSEE